MDVARFLTKFTTFLQVMALPSSLCMRARAPEVECISVRYLLLRVYCINSSYKVLEDFFTPLREKSVVLTLTLSLWFVLVLFSALFDL